MYLSELHVIVYIGTSLYPSAVCFCFARPARCTGCAAGNGHDSLCGKKMYHACLCAAKRHSLREILPDHHHINGQIDHDLANQNSQKETNSRNEQKVLQETLFMYFPKEPACLRFGALVCGSKKLQSTSIHTDHIFRETYVQQCHGSSPQRESSRFEQPLYASPHARKTTLS